MTDNPFFSNGDLTERGQAAFKDALALAKALDMLDDVENGNKTLPYIDPETRKFFCSNGQVIALSNRQVNPMIIMQLTGRGKPEVPKVEVVLLGKHKQIQENPNDPAYKAALRAWETAANNRVMQYIIGVGVNAGPIPDAFVEEYLEYVPDAKESEIKYAYITDIVPVGDFGDLMEAVMGEHHTTTKGLEQVAESFRSDGERQSD